MAKRILTVSALTVANRQAVPFIRLRGKWLHALGFGIGKKFTVKESEGRLILEIAKED